MTAPKHPQLRSADGAEVRSSAVVRGQLRLRLAAPGRTLVRVWSAEKPTIAIDGQAASVAWDRATGLAEVWIAACPQGCDLTVRS